MKISFQIAAICATALLKLVDDPEEINEKAKHFTTFAVNTELDLASKVGKGILLMGGNAVDAAIASAICIGVVNSFSSGIGGGGFMLIRKIGSKEDAFDMIDFREVSPMGIDKAMFAKDPESSRTTGLSVAIPGEVMGFYEAHKKYGRLPWKKLFEENIKLAMGFPASKLLVKKLEKNVEHIQRDPGFRSIYMRNGKIIRVGDIVSRPNYAKTLQTVSKDPLSFYKGELAEKIVKFIGANNGVFDISDMNNYKAEFRSVISSTFYDYKVYTTNIPTSGLFVVEALKALERLNIRDIKFFLNEHNSFYMYHILIEIFKFIISSRGEFGDPSFIEDWRYRVSRVISDAKARETLLKLKLDSVLKAKEYGMNTVFKDDHGTSHLNVVDSEETIVLTTTTINLEFGSKLMDPDTGIIFNNHMDDFYIPGVDNAYGLASMPANILDKGKRPFSSASPMIFIKEDEIIAVGASGGTKIPSSIVTILAYLMTGSSLDAAISSCRIHNQLFPEETLIEPTLPDSVVESLQKLGHRIEVSESNTSFTSVQAIQIKKDRKGKKVIYAVSDSRKDGASDGI